MKSEELPAIYQSADSGSNKSQRNYLRTVKSEYSLIALLAILGEFKGVSRFVVYAISFSLILLFGLLIFRFFSQLDRKWYGCRALAESVKTSSWKFALRAHPYDDAKSVSIPTKNFLLAINEIRRDNEFIGTDLDAKYSDKDQISQKMLDLRKLPYDERLDYYLTNRIKQQRTWYAKKAAWNARRRKFWFGFAVVVYMLAACALFSIDLGGPDFSWSFSFLLVVVTSSFAWIQVKRHGELAASYTLTAHEIGSIQGLVADVVDEQSLSEFVNKAEIAFSREHTQWAARRDFA